MKRHLTLGAVVAAVLGTVAALAALALPSAGAQPPPPTVTATILTDSSLDCNPDGNAGLQVSAQGSTTDGTLSGAYLAVGEIGTVPSTFYPYEPEWSISWWTSYDSWARRTGPTTDSRTLRTTDAATWNSHGYYEFWTGSAVDAWWEVHYNVYQSVQGQGYSDWDTIYVKCNSDGSNQAPVRITTYPAWETEQGLR